MNTNETVTIDHITIGAFGLYAGRSVFLPVLHDEQTKRDVGRMNERQRAYWKRRLLQDARNLPFGAGTPGADSAPSIPEGGRGRDITVIADKEAYRRYLADPVNSVISHTFFMDCPLNDLVVAHVLGLVGDEDLGAANIAEIKHGEQRFSRGDVERGVGQ
jgi:hypothetical protein